MANYSLTAPAAVLFPGAEAEGLEAHSAVVLSTRHATAAAAAAAAAAAGASLGICARAKRLIQERLLVFG